MNSIGPLEVQMALLQMGFFKPGTQINYEAIGHAYQDAMALCDLIDEPTKTDKLAVLQLASVHNIFPEFEPATIMVLASVMERCVTLGMHYNLVLKADSSNIELEHVTFLVRAMHRIVQNLFMLPGGVMDITLSLKADDYIVGAVSLLIEKICQLSPPITEFCYSAVLRVVTYTYMEMPNERLLNPNITCSVLSWIECRLQTPTSSAFWAQDSESHRLQTLLSNVKRLMGHVMFRSYIRDPVWEATTTSLLDSILRLVGSITKLIFQVIPDAIRQMGDERYIMSYPIMVGSYIEEMIEFMKLIRQHQDMYAQLPNVVPNWPCTNIHIVLNYIVSLPTTLTTNDALGMQALASRLVEDAQCVFGSNCETSPQTSAFVNMLKEALRFTPMSLHDLVEQMDPIALQNTRKRKIQEYFTGGEWEMF